jgi:hypothetical protein
MRSFIFYGCIALVAGVGVLIGADQGSWGLAVLFGLKLALVGLALGGLLTFFGGKAMNRKRAKSNQRRDEEWERLAAGKRDGSGTSNEEMAENFWRDKGHAPFTNPEYHDDDSHTKDFLDNAWRDKGHLPFTDPDSFDPKQ